MRFQQRLVISSGAALAVTFLIFVMLSALTTPHQDTLASHSNSKTFDFIRHKSDSDLSLKNRQKPKPPKPKISPPTPKLNISTDIPKPELKMETIDLPKLSVNNLFKGDLLVGANVGSLSMEVIPLVRIAPMYPKRALRMRQEGSVTLSFIINPDGTVRNVKVKTSQPKRIFDNEAIRALKRWKFKPKLVQGKAVAQQGEQTIVFTLQGNK